MAKISPVSGFPEWLPAQKLAEQHILDQIRGAFERFGFTPIETRSVEPVSVLGSKGDDKEIYLLKRMHESEEDKVSDTDRLGLHFDLTVPFARYVQEFQNELVFPFKRYQIQKVWRGERKQEGRYREFYQCDIDVIGMGQLPLYYDAEFAHLLLELVQILPIPPIQLKINNRKVLQGFYQGLGVADISATLRILDKLVKIGDVEVLRLLKSDLAMDDTAANACLALAKIQGSGQQVLDQVRALGVENELLEEGLQELAYVLDFNPAENMLVDFSIARGLDYYTGTVYEGYMLGHEHIGAICSGGRYDNLADGGKQKMPGIGVSLGITRILGYLFGRSLLKAKTATPVKVMVVLNDEASRKEAFDVAQQLRQRNISTDVYHLPQNFGKQMKAAEKRGIPYVCFFDREKYAMKELQTGTQEAVDLSSWLPDEKYEQLRLEAEF